MLRSRSSHSATLLLDGRVLVAGGFVDFSFSSDSAELYDPITGVWTQAGKMRVARSAHTATLQPDGRVLVAGGLDGLDLSQAEIYDPVSDTWLWKKSGHLSVEMSGRHTGTSLQTGRVLVAGGVQDSFGAVANVGPARLP